MPRQEAEFLFLLTHGEELDRELPLLEPCHLLASAGGQKLIDFFQSSPQILLRLRGHDRRCIFIPRLHDLGEQGLVPLQHLLVTQLLLIARGLRLSVRHDLIAFRFADLVAAAGKTLHVGAAHTCIVSQASVALLGFVLL